MSPEVRGYAPSRDWPDGWGIWAWHGVRVPRDVIEYPEGLTGERIEGEENVEVRRAMIERIGMETWLERSGAICRISNLPAN